MLTAHLQTTYVWILNLSSVQFFNNFSASEFDFVRCLIICRYLGFFLFQLCASTQETIHFDATCFSFIIF